MFANHMDGSYMDAIDTYIVVDVARYVTWHSLRDPYLEFYPITWLET